MADGDLEKEGGKEATKQKSSSVKAVIVTVVLMVILVVGGFLGWNLLMNKEGNEIEPEQRMAESQEKKKVNDAKILCPIESFIVNLMDKSGMGKRYLKVTMELEVGNEVSKAVIDTHKTQLKDTILLLLSGLSFEEINSIEGKLSLKQALLSRTNQVLGGNIVRRIYFTEFVVQ